MRSRTPRFALAVAASLLGCGVAPSPGRETPDAASPDAGADGGRRDAAGRDSSDEGGTWSSPDASCGSAGTGDAGADGAACPAPSAGLVALVSGLDHPAGLALRSNDLYWSDGAYEDNLATRVNRVSVCGGAPSTILSRPEPLHVNFGIGPIAIDSGYLYWAEAEPLLGHAIAEIVRMPLGGGCATTLAVWAGTIDIAALTLASSNVYWEAFTPGGGEGSVLRAPQSGGSPVVLTTQVEPGDPIGAGGGSVYWLANTGPNPFEGGKCHPTARVSLMRVPSGGGSTTVAATDDPAISTLGSAVVTDAENAYWTTSGRPECVKNGLGVAPSSGTVMKVPLAGGTPVTLAAGQDHPGDLAVDGTHVYWISRGPGGPTGDFASGAIVRVPISGGAPGTIASKLSHPRSLVVDATSVYWLSEVTQHGTLLPATGGIWKLTPK